MDRNDASPLPVLTRRQTLWAMAGIATFGLAGCGGGGHGGTKSVSTSSSATPATLPSGFTLPVAGLKGETAFGSATVAANGSFAAKVRGNGAPTFAWLRDTASGKFVLFGFAGSGQTGVSAMGSATAILALAFGVGALPPTAAASLVSLIESDAATATLAAAIEARVAADPFALTDGDATIAAAVQTAVASLGGASPALAKSVTRADPSPILSIAPQDQSGSNVIQKDQADAIIPVNEIRRPASVYTYQTGYVTSDGTTTVFPTAVAFAGPEDLAPTTSLTGSLASLGVRPAFGPVEGSATTLKTYNDTVTKTLYETVILMASGKVDGIDPDPSFFSDPKYASVLSTWQAKRQELNKHAWIGGILLDLFSSVIGGVTTWISASLVTAAIADIEAAGADAEALVVKAATGDVLTATLGCLKGIGSTNALTSKYYKQAIADTLVKAEGFSEAAVTGEMLTAIGGLAALALGTLAAAGTLLGLADLGFTYKDMLTSDKGDLWSETLLKPSVVISPTTGTVSAGGNLTLTAATPGTSETNYKFHWTLDSGSNGNLGDPTGAVSPGRNITTAGNSVNLATAPSDVVDTVYTIKVEALDLKTGASLGSATAKITIASVPNSQIIPATKTEVQGTNSGDPSAPFFFEVFATFSPVSGATIYNLMEQPPGASAPYDIATSVRAKDLPSKALDGSVVGNALNIIATRATTQESLDAGKAQIEGEIQNNLYFVRAGFDPQDA